MDTTASPSMSGVANGTGDGAVGASTDLGRAQALLAVAFILTTSMIVVVVLRIYLRASTGIKSVRLVDWMHILAAMFSVAVSVTVGLSVRFGAGQRRLDISGDTIQGLKFNWVSKMLYIAATWVAKMAIFTTLLTIASAPPQQARKFLKPMLYCAMVFMTSYSVVFWVATVVECRPASYIYNKNGIQGGRCISAYLVKLFANTHSSMNTAMDLFFLLLPVFMAIYGVKRSMRENVTLAGVFLLGFFAVVAAAVHTLYEFGYHETGEPLFDSANLSIWAMVEINVGLIAVNLPALSSLFRNLLQPQHPPALDDPPALDSYTGRNSPATPLSTYRPMTQHNRSESQRNILDQYNPETYPAHTYPLVMTSNALEGHSSSSKSNLGGVMVQVEVDLQQHPAFRERERPVIRPQNAATDVPEVGPRRVPTPLMF